MMAAEIKTGERAVTTATREAGNSLKSAWRAQITGAGLGQRLARTIRSEQYPKGKPSLNAAAMVWSKAPVIVGAHDAGPLIRSKSGFWLTIPVESSGKYHQRINQTRIADGRWARAHLQSLRHALARAPRFKGWLLPRLEAWYDATAQETMLSDVNRILIQAVMTELGITTALHSAQDLPQADVRSARLLGMCKALGATTYLSGPSARSYLDEALFQNEGIAVEWMDYPAYPSYTQADGGHDPAVSILDALAYLPPEQVF